MRRSRGFTLIELLVVLVIMGPLTAMIGAFYLEARISAAMIEAEILLEREASLTAESLAKDLRYAGSARSNVQGLSIQTAAGETVAWSIDGQKLVRKDQRSRQVLHRHAHTLTVEPVKEGWQASLVLRRPLLGRRAVKVKRQVFVRGAR